MKAFISYSVSDNNEYIISSLSYNLRQQNFVVNTSQNFYSNLLDYGTMNEISESHLFVGVITYGGNEINRVQTEWQYAVSKKIPNLLLIEDNVQVNQNFTGNFVRFNRNNPQPAIQEINRRMSAPQTGVQSKSNEIVPWILGGAALLAILSLFSKDK